MKKVIAVFAVAFLSVKWKGGTAPTLSAISGAVDIVAFYYNGTYY